MKTLSQKHYKGIVVNGADQFQSQDELIDAILNGIARTAGIVIPQDVIDQEAKLLMQAYLAQMRYAKLSSGGYLPTLRTITENQEAYQEYFQDLAVRELQREQVLREIIEAETLTVTQEELEAEAAAIAARQEITVQEVKAFMGDDLAMLKPDLLKRKARQLVYHYAELR